LNDTPQISYSPSVSQAVLDALPEPVLLWSTANHALRPVNAAAVEWLSRGANQGDLIHFADLFPELNPGDLRNSSAALVFTRAKPAGTDTQEVVLRILQITPDGDRAGTPQSIAIIVRAVNRGADERAYLPRDAFDDSFHDWLTRLPNRRLFQRRLERAIERGIQADYQFAVLFIDLDGFKRVNDQFGHLEGDRLLMITAHRMLEAVRPQDMVARRDGDEFTILLDDLARTDDAIHIAQRIIQHVGEPMPLDGAAPVTIGASIGIAMSGDGGSSVDDLIARADAAMYQAKASGGGAFIVAPTPPAITGNIARRTRRLPR
jgi:diguanylate cyclase (GGDEF)-like protein